VFLCVGIVVVLLMVTKFDVVGKAYLTKSGKGVRLRIQDNSVFVSEYYLSKQGLLELFSGSKVWLQIVKKTEKDSDVHS